MFYICDIYDKATTVHVKTLFLNRKLKYDLSKDTLRCNLTNIDHISTIMICVYDSKDGSKEWYYLLDLFKIIASTNVEIDSIKFDYYANAGTKRPDSLESLKDVIISAPITMEEASKDYTTTVTKHRLLGTDIGVNGVLKNIPASLVKGDTLFIPKEAHSLVLNLCSPSVSGRNVTKIVVPESLCTRYKIRDTGSSLYYLTHGWVENEERVFLIIDGDFNLIPNTFERLYCNIYVRGTLSTAGMRKSLQQASVSLYRPPFRMRSYIVADSRFIYTLDYKNGVVTRETNNKLYL